MPRRGGVSFGCGLLIVSERPVSRPRSLVVSLPIQQGQFRETWSIMAHPSFLSSGNRLVVRLAAALVARPGISDRSGGRPRQGLLCFALEQSTLERRRHDARIKPIASNR